MEVMSEYGCKSISVSKATSVNVNAASPDGLVCGFAVVVVCTEVVVSTGVESVAVVVPVVVVVVSVVVVVVAVNPVFQPRYYFLGLRQSAQQTNATLYQTIGWEDYSHGGMGTFDPLAE